MDTTTQRRHRKQTGSPQPKTDQASQNDEERVILEYFGDYVGTFIDIGCNDCLTFSNSRALALRGWKGIFVDPIPEAIKRCKKLYEGHKGFYFYELAITDHNGKKVIDASGSLCSPSDIGLVSTFHAHEKARFSKSVKFTPLEVKASRWKTFLNMKRITEFDCVLMDVEGSEMEILPEMDLTKTKLICIEHNGSQSLKKAYLECSSKYGIDKIIYESGENVIICR